MTFLSFLLASDLLAVLHGVLDSRFKLCAFIVNGLIKGEIEKPSGQFLSLIVLLQNSNQVLHALFGPHTQALDHISLALIWVHDQNLSSSIDLFFTVICS
jgi:hypothetical protein